MRVGLADQHCIPCWDGLPPLECDRVAALLVDLEGSWTVTAADHLERSYALPNLAEALGLANAIGVIAEEQGHHPDLTIRRGECRVELWTHRIGGLTQSDFYLAAKISRAAHAR
jgi:4a-hydroxytetrahydrobiopterin dehydratase